MRDLVKLIVSINIALLPKLVLGWPRHKGESFMKKILLSLVTFLSVAICSVVAFIGLSSTPKTAIGGGL